MIELNQKQNNNNNNANSFFHSEVLSSEDFANYEARVLEATGLQYAAITIVSFEEVRDASATFVFLTNHPHGDAVCQWMHPHGVEGTYFRF